MGGSTSLPRRSRRFVAIAVAVALAAASASACSKRAPPPDPPRSAPIDLEKPGSVEVAIECARAGGLPLTFVVVRDGRLRERAFGKGNLEAHELSLRLTATNESGALVKRWDLDAKTGLENVTWRAPDTTIALTTPGAGAMCDAAGRRLTLRLEVVRGTSTYAGASSVWVVSEVAK